MSFLRTVFSLGLASKQSPMRECAVMVSWPMYGSPTERELLSLLKKYFDRDEAEFIVENQRLLYGQLYFSNVTQAQKFCRAFERKYNTSTHVCNDGAYMMPDGHLVSLRTTLCTGCGRLGGRAYRAADGLVCSTCNHVVHRLDELKPKEVKRYVEAAAKARVEPTIATLDELDTEGYMDRD